MAAGKKTGGRRKGTKNKLTVQREKQADAVAAAAIAAGLDPLQIMLDNMRHFQQVAIDAEATLAGLTAEEINGQAATPEEQFKLLLAKAKQAAGLRVMASEAARDAAPYIHPRLSAVEHSGGMTLTHEQALDELEKAEAEMNGHESAH